MKKTYSSPSLVEYGTAYDLTLGSSGPVQDFILVGQELVPDPVNPNCETNAGLYVDCIRLP